MARSGTRSDRAAVSIEDVECIINSMVAFKRGFP